MGREVGRRTTKSARWRLERRIARDKAQLARLLIAILLLACLMAFYGYKHWNAEPRIAIIGKPWLIDGDTIELSGTRIRLEGIDAPELDQTCTDRDGKAWACGRAAVRELHAHIHGRELTCKGRARDRYQRVLAVCTLPDGSDINGWMVQQGWALAYGFARLYASEQDEAEQARRGLWTGSFVPPSRWRQNHND